MDTHFFHKLALLIRFLSCSRNKFYQNPKCEILDEAQIRGKEEWRQVWDLL